MVYKFRKVTQLFFLYLFLTIKCYGQIGKEVSSEAKSLIKKYLFGNYAGNKNLVEMVEKDLITIIKVGNYRYEKRKCEVYICGISFVSHFDSYSILFLFRDNSYIAIKEQDGCYDSLIELNKEISKLKGLNTQDVLLIYDYFLSNFHSFGNKKGGTMER